MKKDLVEAILIIDRSGSMSSIQKSTISGINEVINAQKTSGKNVKITLAQFDTEYEVLVDCVDASLVGEITDATYVPRGMTALHDAIGRTINSVGNRLANTPEDERPERVLFTIITDGFENASTDFDSAKIKSMIEHQTNKYGWGFAYLGANQDAILVSSKLGIARGSTMTFLANDTSNSAMYTSVANMNNRFYTTGSLSFTDEERAAVSQTEPTSTGLTFQTNAVAMANNVPTIATNTTGTTRTSRKSA